MGGSDTGRRFLVINPNSTHAITEGLQKSLEPHCPLNARLHFFTAPQHAPTGIRDFRTGVQTAAICFDALQAGGCFDDFDGFLVCCFTDHPLQHMIREHLGPVSPKACIGIFEAGISRALMESRRFGVLSTGIGHKPLLRKGVSSFLGASASDKWIGGVTSGLAIETLQSDSHQRQVKEGIQRTAAALAELGADCIILGCAGMSGMEDTVRTGVKEAGFREVRVIDPAVTGLLFLVSLCN